VSGGSLVRADLAVLSQRPREVLSGRFPVGGRSKTVAEVKLGALRAGVRTQVTELRRGKGPPAAGIYVVRANAVTRAGKLRARGSAIVVRVGHDGRFVNLLQPQRSVAPGAFTNRAGSISQLGAALLGKVVSGGQRNAYHFEYGPTTAYGAQTASQTTRSQPKVVHVSANAVGLSFATTYHYRLVATNCGGCVWGTSYGADRTFTTRGTAGLPSWQVDADRAVATYNAIQQYFYATDGSSLYLQPQGAKHYSYLWPFSRMLDGTIALAGIPSNVLGGASYGAALADRLQGLSRYWDGTGYESYPPAPYGSGGDKYYDDAGWVGLASAQAYHLTGNPVALQDARNALNFAYPGGWAGGASFESGGIYWVNQGTGVGVNNHNRTTNSNAPHAETALLLAALDPTYATTYENDAANIYAWVNHYLYNVYNAADPQGPNPNYDPTQPALMFDKVRGGNTIDKTLWTYNQGAMIAANVREYQTTGQSAYLQTAEAIATTALSTFNETGYLNNQPAAFNAIFFRGLLVLYSTTGDAGLRAQIIQTIQTYADDSWSYYRSSNGLFQFPSSAGSGYQLLDQGAMLEIYAMLAWDPANYGELP
jgi:hypothetical protein